MYGLCFYVSSRLYVSPILIRKAVCTNSGKAKKSYHVDAKTLDIECKVDTMTQQHPCKDILERSISYDVVNEILDLKSGNLSCCVILISAWIFSSTRGPHFIIVIWTPCTEAFAQLTAFIH